MPARCLLVLLIALAAFTTTVLAQPPVPGEASPLRDTTAVRDIERILVLLVCAAAIAFAVWKAGWRAGVPTVVIYAVMFYAVVHGVISSSVVVGFALASFLVIPMVQAALPRLAHKGIRLSRNFGARLVPETVLDRSTLALESERRHEQARTLERLAARQLAEQRKLWAAKTDPGDETQRRLRSEILQLDETNPRLGRKARSSGQDAPAINDTTPRLPRGVIVIEHDDPTSEPDVYMTPCFSCNTAFDAKGALVCDCLAKTRTLVCPACQMCFCRAPRGLRQKFWAEAPMSISERVRSTMTRLIPPMPLLQDVKRPLLVAVEDDPDIHRIIQSVCKRLGYESIHAANGVEGLVAARQYLPDLIITDAFMPKLDGREMCRILKTDPTTSHIPVVVMSGLYLGLKYRAEAHSFFHADDYLTKPVTVGELAYVLRTHLEAARTSVEAESEPVVAEPLPHVATSEAAVSCFHCGSSIEVEKINWCRCKGDEGTLLCPYCLRCCCDAPVAIRNEMTAVVERISSLEQPPPSDTEIILTMETEDTATIVGVEEESSESTLPVAAGDTTVVSDEEDEPAEAMLPITAADTLPVLPPPEHYPAPKTSPMQTWSNPSPTVRGYAVAFEVAAEDEPRDR